MLRIPRPSGPDPAEVEWARVVTHAGKLVEAMEALAEAGGACKAASVGRWSPDAHTRALAILTAVSELAEAEAGRLEMRTRHFPARARRRLG